MVWGIPELFSSPLHSEILRYLWLLSSQKVWIVNTTNRNEMIVSKNGPASIPGRRKEDCLAAKGGSVGTLALGQDIIHVQKVPPRDGL